MVLIIINFGVPNMHVGTILDSKDAIFFENEFYMKIHLAHLAMNPYYSLNNMF